MATPDAMVEEGATNALARLLASRTFPPEELGQALHVAARLGRTAAIQSLVAAGASLEATAGEAKWTPLHTAVEHGRLETIRELVTLGADIDAKAAEGMTPLHLAIDAATDAAWQLGTAEDLRVVELLLDLGADPRLTMDSGDTPTESI
jgi:ankyrin repeat protein